MKKLFSISIMLMLVVGMLASCGANAGKGSTKDYKTVIESARTQDENSAFPVINDVANDGSSMILSTLGLSSEMMQKFGISASSKNMQAYSVAIVFPAQGQEQAVTDALNAFVAGQQQAMDGYLPDQYAIAKAAIVKKVATGEVILVMCTDASKVASAIEKGLKA